METRVDGVPPVARRSGLGPDGTSSDMMKRGDRGRVDETRLEFRWTGPTGREPGPEYQPVHVHDDF